MACQKKEEKQIDQYLDGELNAVEKKELFAHFEECPACAAHYRELNKTVMFVQSTSHLEAPPRMTDQIMQNLPSRKRKPGWRKWGRRHPIMAAAAIFVLLMSSSMMSIWNDQSAGQIAVAGGENVEVDHEHGKVIVPEGEVVQGDLMVRNGEVEVHGEIQGDLTVINGEPYLASAGHVAGDIEDVDQALEWMWYYTKKFTTEAFTWNTEE